MRIRVDSVAPPIPAHQAAVADGYKQHDLAAFPVERRESAVLLRDGDRLIGGAKLLGYGADLYVLTLWIDAARRGQGLGAAVMAAAEATATDRGFRRILLNTMSFQAPRFYEGLGYAEFGAAADFIHGGTMHFLHKVAEPRALPQFPAPLSLDIVDGHAHEDIDALDVGLEAHWLEATGAQDEPFGVYATDGGELIGGANVAREKSYAIVVQGWVRPDRRGQGVGRKLLAEAESFARSEGCATITALPYVWQAPEFFRRAGYAELAYIPNYLCGRDRWIVRKSLEA